jgi:hypothetical protein
MSSNNNKFKFEQIKQTTFQYGIMLMIQIF